jgi:hypothetical protein
MDLGFPGVSPMNVAGVMAAAYYRYGDFSWDAARRVIDESALPYDPLPTESAAALSDFVSQVPVMTFAEMLETGRVGLFTIDEQTYRRSTERLRRVDRPDEDTWLEAFSITDGQRLVAPQVQTGVTGVYLIGPVAEGPALTRLTIVDSGMRTDNGPQPPSVVQGKCGRGVDDDLKWICLPGSCTGRCEPDGWTTGPGPAELTGCSCL